MDLAKICSGCYADFDSDLSIKTGRTCRVSIPESRLVSKQKQGVHGPPNCNRQQQTVQEACILAKLTCTCCICDANSPPARCTSLPGLFFLLRNVSKNTTLDQGMMADDSLDDQERDFFAEVISREGPEWLQSPMGLDLRKAFRARLEQKQKSTKESRRRENPPLHVDLTDSEPGEDTVPSLTDLYVTFTDDDLGKMTLLRSHVHALSVKGGHIAGSILDFVLERRGFYQHLRCFNQAVLALHPDGETSRKPVLVMDATVGAQTELSDEQFQKQLICAARHCGLIDSVAKSSRPYPGVSSAGSVSLGQGFHTISSERGLVVLLPLFFEFQGLIKHWLAIAVEIFPARENSHNDAEIYILDSCTAISADRETAEALESRVKLVASSLLRQLAACFAISVPHSADQPLQYTVPVSWQAKNIDQVDSRPRRKNACYASKRQSSLIRYIEVPEQQPGGNLCAIHTALNIRAHARKLLSESSPSESDEPLSYCTPARAYCEKKMLIASINGAPRTAQSDSLLAAIDSLGPDTLVVGDAVDALTRSWCSQSPDSKVCILPSSVAATAVHFGVYVQGEDDEDMKNDSAPSDSDADAKAASPTATPSDCSRELSDQHKSTGYSSPSFDEIYKFLGKKLELSMTKRFALLPLCGHGHWCLVVVDFLRSAVLHIDSLHQENSECQAFDQFSTILVTALAVSGVMKTPEIVHLPLKAQKGSKRGRDADNAEPKYGKWERHVPRQENETDCGVFMLAFIEDILKARAFSIRQNLALTYREKLEVQLIKASDKLLQFEI